MSSPERKKKKMKQKIDMIPVLAPEHYGNVKLMKVFVSKINKKHANVTLKLLQSKFNSNEISHLKRIKRAGDEIIVLLCKETNTEVLASISKELFDALPTNDDKTPPIEPFIVEVPKISPVNKIQLEESLKHWPLKVLEKSLVNPFDLSQTFSELQLESLTSHMEYLVEKSHRALLDGTVPIFSVLIDPRTLEIVAEGQDSSNCNPLAHATMNCIENRSKCAKKDDYLCSGLWLMTTREPCAMCAMAAVHSRISSVFYGSDNSQLGALGSRYNLHLEAQLNHHYTVFKNLQYEKNTKIWNKFISHSTSLAQSS